MKNKEQSVWKPNSEFLIDWLIIYCFTSRSRIFHVYGDVKIAGEGLQNLGLCSALRPLSREGSLSCHACCDTGPRFFRSHPKDRPIQSPLTTRMGMLGIYSDLDPHRGSEFLNQMWLTPLRIFKSNLVSTLLYGSVMEDDQNHQQRTPTKNKNRIHIHAS
jgi:hypothetical protein